MALTDSEKATLDNWFQKAVVVPNQLRAQGQNPYPDLKVDNRSPQQIQEDNRASLLAPGDRLYYNQTYHTIVKPSQNDVGVGIRAPEQPLPVYNDVGTRSFTLRDTGIPAVHTGQPAYTLDHSPFPATVASGAPQMSPNLQVNQPLWYDRTTNTITNVQTNEAVFEDGKGGYTLNGEKQATYVPPSKPEDVNQNKDMVGGRVMPIIAPTSALLPFLQHFALTDYAKDLFVNSKTPLSVHLENGEPVNLHSDPLGYALSSTQEIVKNFASGVGRATGIQPLFSMMWSGTQVLQNQAASDLQYTVNLAQTLFHRPINEIPVDPKTGDRLSEADVIRIAPTWKSTSPIQSEVHQGVPSDLVTFVPAQEYYANQRDKAFNAINGFFQQLQGNAAHNIQVMGRTGATASGYAPDLTAPLIEERQGKLVQSNALTQLAFANPNKPEAVQQRVDAINLYREAGGPNGIWDPYFTYTGESNPEQQKRFINAVASAEVQLGRPLTGIEIYNVGEHFKDPFQEMAGDMTFDALNFAMGLGVDEKLIKPAFKVAGEIIGEGLSKIHIPVIQEIVGDFATKAVRSAAHQFSHSFYDILVNLATALPKTDDLLAKLDDIGMALKRGYQSGEDIANIVSLPRSFGDREWQILNKLGSAIRSKPELEKAMSPHLWGDFAESAVNEARNQMMAEEAEKLIKAGKASTMDEAVKLAKPKVTDFFGKASNVLDYVTAAARSKYMGSFSVEGTKLTSDSLLYRITQHFVDNKLLSPGTAHAVQRLVGNFNSYTRNVWTQFVLSARPAWMARNYVDNMFRYLLFGGNLWDGIDLMSAGKIGQMLRDAGIEQTELTHTFARSELGENANVALEMISGRFKPNRVFGLWDFAKREWGMQREKGMEEMTKALSENRSWLGNLYANATNGLVARGWKTWIGTISDFNAAIEYSFRARMFQDTFYKNFNKLNGRALDNWVRLLEGAGASQDTVDHFMRIWRGSGTNADLLQRQMEAALLGSPLERYTLMPPEMMDDWLKAIPEGQRSALIEDLSGRFQKYVEGLRLEGKSVTEDTVHGFFQDLRNQLDEMQGAAVNAPDLRDHPDMGGAANLNPEDAPGPVPTEGMKPTANRQLMVEGKIDPVQARTNLMRAMDTSKGLANNFRDALAERADVVEADLGNDLYRVTRTGDRIKVELSTNLIDKPALETRQTLTKAVGEMMALEKEPAIRNSGLFATRDFQKGFQEFLTNPARMQREDPDLFRFMVTQFDQSPELRQVVANLRGVRDLSYYKLVASESDLAARVRELGYAVDSPEYQRLLDSSYYRAGEAQRVSFAKVHDEVDRLLKIGGQENVTQSSQMLRRIEDLSALRDNLHDFLLKVFPGPLNKTGTIERKDAWDVFAQIAALTSDRLSEHANAMVKGTVDLSEPKSLEELMKLVGFRFDYKDGRLAAIRFKVAEHTQDIVTRKFAYPREQFLKTFFGQAMMNTPNVEQWMKAPYTRDLYAKINGEVSQELLNKIGGLIGGQARLEQARLDMYTMFKNLPNPKSDAEIGKQVDSVLKWWEGTAQPWMELTGQTFNDYIEQYYPIIVNGGTFLGDNFKEFGDSLWFHQQYDRSMWYLKSEKVLTDLPQSKMGAAELLRYLQDPKRGVKAEELKWMGIEDFLKGKGNATVTKEDMLEFVQNNQIMVVPQEALHGNEIIPEWKADQGGKYWRIDNIPGREQVELLGNGKYRADAGYGMHQTFNTLDEAQGWIEQALGNGRQLQTPTKWEQYMPKGGENYRELLLIKPQQVVKDPLVVQATETARKELEPYLAMKNEWIDERVSADWTRMNDAEQALNAMRGADPDSPEWRSAYREFLISRDNYQSAIEKAKADFMTTFPERYTYMDSLENQILSWEQENVAIPDFQYATHWNEDNVLSHVRFDDRVDEQGRKVLYVNEIQSDWHQQGRKYGYKGPDGLPVGWTVEEVPDPYGGDAVNYIVRNRDGELVASNGRTWDRRHGVRLQDAAFTTREQAIENARAMGGSVNVAPFSKTQDWSMMTMKRMLNWASENGYDRIAWSTGDIQDALWSKMRVKWEPNILQPDRMVHKIDQGYLVYINGEENFFDGFEDAMKFASEEPQKVHDWTVTVYSEDSGHELGHNVLVQKAEDLASLPGEAGSAWKDRIWKGIQETPNGGTVAPIKEGMSGFYDTMLPSEVDKYAKKMGWESRVADGKIRVGYEDAYGYEVVDTEGHVIAETRNVETAMAAREPGWGVRAKKGYEDVHTLEITPQMKNDILKGQSLFQTVGSPSMDQATLENYARSLVRDAKKEGDVGQLRRAISYESDQQAKVALYRELKKQDPALVAQLDAAMRTLKQSDSQIVKAAVRFTDDHKAVVYVFNQGDFSSIVHEFSHIYRQVLQDMSQMEGGEGFVKDLQSILKATGETSWNRNAEEKFARMYETYIRDGIAPTAELTDAFTNMKKWMTEIYKNLGQNSELYGIDLNRKVDGKQSIRDIFDGWLGKDTQTQENTQKWLGMTINADGTQKLVAEPVVGQVVGDVQASGSLKLRAVGGKVYNWNPDMQTIFVDPKDLRISAFPNTEEINYHVEMQDGKAAMVGIDKDGNRYLHEESITPFETKPRVGLVPVEVLDDGYRVDVGSKIEEIIQPEIPQLPAEAGTTYKWVDLTDEEKAQIAQVKAASTPPEPSPQDIVRTQWQSPRFNDPNGLIVRNQEAQYMMVDTYNFEMDPSQLASGSNWKRAINQKYPWTRRVTPLLSKDHGRQELVRALQEVVSGAKATKTSLNKRLREVIVENLEKGVRAEGGTDFTRLPHPYFLQQLGTDEKTVQEVLDHWSAKGMGNPIDYMDQLGKSNENRQALWQAFISQPMGGTTLKNSWGQFSNSPEYFAAYLRDLISTGATAQPPISQSSQEALQLLLWQVENFNAVTANFSDKFGIIRQSLLDGADGNIPILPPITRLPENYQTWIYGANANASQHAALTDALDKWETVTKGHLSDVFQLSPEEADKLRAVMNDAARTKQNVIDIAAHGFDNNLKRQAEETLGVKLTDDLQYKIVKRQGVTVNEALDAREKGILAKLQENLDYNQKLVDMVGGSLDGALPLTQKRMIDYSDFTRFDEAMRNIVPFWMFASRSVPFWLETMALHPEIPVFYNKYIAMTKRIDYQKGAVTTDGDPLPSLEGYLPVPGTDFWFNPTAPLSMRFAFPRGNYYQDDMEGTTMMGQVLSYMYEYANVFGASLAPWLTALVAFTNPGKYPVNAIIPEMELMPRWWRDSLVTQMRRVAGVNSLPDNITRYLVGDQVPWFDYLVERRLLANTVEQIKEANNPADKKALGLKAKQAILDRENNPLWNETVQEMETSDLKASWAGFFTGVYAKPFTDAEAKLLGVRDDINTLRDSINNDTMADLFEMDKDAENRYQLYSDTKYNTPEGQAYTIYNLMRYTQLPDGEQLRGQDRRDYIEQKLGEDETTSAYYTAKSKAYQELQDFLLKQPIGVDPKDTQKAYNDYWAAIDKIENDPMYAVARRDWASGYKPESMIDAHFKDYWFKAIRDTAPKYDSTKENWDAYQERYNQWLLTIPSMASGLRNTIAQRLNQELGDQKPGTATGSIDVGQAEALIPGAGKVQLAGNRTLDVTKMLDQLTKETTPEEFQKWEKAKNSSIEALDNAWKDLYWNKYWDALKGKTGYERQLAEQEWLKANPAPTNEQLLAYVQANYAPGQFKPEELQTILSGRSVNTIDARLAPQTDAAKQEQEIWDILAEAGPNKGKLQKEFERLGGYWSDVSTFYNVGGSSTAWSDPKKFQQFHDLLVRAAGDLNFQEPDQATLQEWTTAQGLKKNLDQKVTDTFGDSFIQDVMTPYWNANTVTRRSMRSKDPRIQQYYDLIDGFAADNPLYAKYYVQSTATSSTVAAGYGSGGYYNSYGTWVPAKYIPGHLADVSVAGTRTSLVARELLGGIGKGAPGKPMYIPAQYTPGYYKKPPKAKAAPSTVAIALKRLGKAAGSIGTDQTKHVYLPEIQK